MDKRVYYGEYSLKHWLDLIIKENIVLPWYQRSFVWDKIQIESLIRTFDDNQFIPPIIIGAVKKSGEWKNYILDGQQRLTSILFAKLNQYIDTKEFLAHTPNAKVDEVADDLPENEDDVVDEKTKAIRWNFKEVIKEKQFNKKELESTFYKKLLETPKTENWFEEHFLGFAFIKPSNIVNEEAQSRFYSDIFRNINIGGSKLTRLESRKALYFLKEDLKDFFVPEFLTNYKVETSSKESGLIDFIKYLSITSQINGSFASLQKYGGRDWEKNENYYHKYITAVVDNNSNNELKFDVSYPTNPYSNERIEKLKQAVTQFEIPKSFLSIIEMDMYFFGLVNEVVFLNKQLDETKKEKLRDELNAKIEELKETENHRYNPYAIKYLKARVNASIEIYRSIELPQNA